MVVESLLVVDIDGEDFRVRSCVEWIVRLFVCQLRLETFRAASTVDRDLENLVLELGCLIIQPLVGLSGIPRKTLGELLLFLGAMPGLVQNDHHFAHVDIFGINRALATHLDHLSDLVLRLACVLRQSCVLHLDRVLRGETFWLEDSCRPRVLALSIVLVETLTELLVIGARACIGPLLVARGQSCRIFLLNVAHLLLVWVDLDLERCVRFLLKSGCTGVIFGHRESSFLLEVGSGSVALSCRVILQVRFGSTIQWDQRISSVLRCCLCLRCSIVEIVDDSCDVGYLLLAVCSLTAVDTFRFVDTRRGELIGKLSSHGELLLLVLGEWPSGSTRLEIVRLVSTVLLASGWHHVILSVDLKLLRWQRSVPFASCALLNLLLARSFSAARALTTAIFILCGRA